MTTLKVGKIARMISLSLKNAKEEKFVELVAPDAAGAVKIGDSFYRLGDGLIGWKIDTSTTEPRFTKVIPVPAIFTSENAETPGGVPNLPDSISTDDFLNAMNELVELGVPCEVLVKAMNNSLYLFENTKNKPKAAGTIDDIRAAYFKAVPASDPAFMDYVKAATAKNEKEFLKSWYAKQ